LYLFVFNMIAKASLLTMALVAVRVQAQEFINHDLYSVETCDPDPNDLEVQSFQLGVSPEKDGDGNDYSGCMEATIVLKAGLPLLTANTLSGLTHPSLETDAACFSSTSLALRRREMFGHAATDFTARFRRTRHLAVTWN
jgi:hypothetical protein